MKKSEAAFIAICAVAPGGLLALGVVAIFMPKFRKTVLDIKDDVVKAVKNRLD